MGCLATDRTALIQIVHSANSLDAAADALKSIKNDLIGHAARKAQYIQYGLLPALAKTLHFVQRSAAHNASVVERVWTEAAYLLTLLAHQGPAYVQPIINSEVLSSLMRRLPQSTACRESVTILRCLIVVADNLPPKEPGGWSPSTYLTDLLFASDALDTVISYIATSKTSSSALRLCHYSIALVCKTCTTEQHKRLLTDKRLLNILAGRLASFIVREGLVIPNLELLDFPTSTSSSLPAPLADHARLSPTLEGIALLVEDSKERAEALLSDPAISSVLSQPGHDHSPAELRPSVWPGSQIPSTLTLARNTNALDDLLPFVPPKEKYSAPANLNFPPLGAGPPGPRRRSSFHPPATAVASITLIQDTDVEVDEPPLIPCLLYIARQSRGLQCLLACRVLAALRSLDLVPTYRHRSFSSLVAPIVVAMLDHDISHQSPLAIKDSYCLSNGLHYSRAAASTLAALIRDHVELQKAAVEAKAISKLSSGLKKTFETPTEHRVNTWRPMRPSVDATPDHAPDCAIGLGGPSNAMRQDMAHREATLQALAAIAPIDDVYRKEICDQGILQHIVLSLEPFQSPQDLPADQALGIKGNSASTIVAACGAVTALTRSVTALRTKFVDINVTRAIINLMNIRDPEVRIAATTALANLALDFSPMKESLLESAVVKKLCEQAHSANARLRLESIFTLKGLVVNASKKLKQEVVNELGSSWIKLLIKTNPFDIPPGEVIGLVDKDYPPRTSVDTGAPDDVVMSEDSDTGLLRGLGDASSELEADTEFNRHTPEEDLAIQATLIDLVRNLFCGDNAADIVDYLLGEIDKDEFFAIILSRMRPRTQIGPTRNSNLSIPAPLSIITRVLYVIIHISATSSKWRTQLSQEHAILKQVVSFASHSNADVRAQCCWVVINLLFEDEENDRNVCRKRALELQRIGLASSVKKLETDADTDVRERAKTAVQLFTRLLEGR
ncbi:hypothetical protein DV736_g1582, partial [Chaetothyriales sp. CBS 134916]